MRILANENVAGEAVKVLRERGHDVAWVREDAPGSSDAVVLSRAQTEDRIVVTFDKDFGELAFGFGLPASSGVVLFRVPTPSSLRAAELVVAALETRADWAGHFAVVEEHRVRMTPLPSLGREGP
jgi:predicted nuclease of predicted toxin-antitoxin system